MAINIKTIWVHYWCMLYPDVTCLPGRSRQKYYKIIEENKCGSLRHSSRTLYDNGLPVYIMNG